MVNMISVIAIFLVWCTSTVSASECNAKRAEFVKKRLMADASECEVASLTHTGAVCGIIRTSYKGASYASFRGMPYARQPLGELRFLAPQPVEPWVGYFNATIEGPICPQRNYFYGPMLRPNSMGEDCLCVNVHVPAVSLPDYGSDCSGNDCLPVVVFVPGGGFSTGSGDSDMNGAEYIMDHDIVYISLNYRLGPFGFLSLNTSSIPGNAGLRDIVAALEWVQLNVRAFGGDPARVTLMGQSAGAAAAHLLSLSEAAQGLFTKLIVMSGCSSSGFYSTSPSYAQYATTSFLTILGINSTEAEETLDKLNKLPYDTIVDANSKLLELLGFTGFVPVVESQFHGVTRILDDDPALLVARGTGNNYPILIGFTNKECELLKPNLESINILAKIKQNPTAALPKRLLFSAATDVLASAAEKVMERYFNGTQTLDKFIPACTDSYFIYPALKLAETRATTGGAPVFLYQFSYISDSSPVKKAFGGKYMGAVHLDDLTYVLRVNSILQNTTLNASDNSVTDRMTATVVNFARSSSPTCEANRDSWPAVASPVQYQDISSAAYAMSGLTAEQQTMYQLFDSFYIA